MRRPALVVLPLCLLLSACAPEDRGADAPVQAAAPVAPTTPAPETAADDHAHHHDAAAGLALERPPGGGSWATDAALRQGMQTIHVALVAALPAFEKGELNATAARALASEVTAQVQYLIANCKLEPAADAQLHILIGQMMSAAEAMVADAASAEGVPRLHEAVQAYGDYFDHPGLHDETGEPHHADGEHEHDSGAADPAGS